MVEDTNVENTAEEVKVKDDTLELDDYVADKLLEDIKNGYREWEYEGKRYVTRFPTAKEDAESRWQYSKAFNKALVEGLPTQKEMRATLANRGIWTEQDEEELSKLRNQIGTLEEILAKKKTTDKSKKTANLVAELLDVRVKVLEKTSSLSDYMNQTVEAIADEQKAAFVVSAVTEDEDGNPVWGTFEEYLTDHNTGLVGTATYQYMTFSNGLPEDYIAELPEVKFMRAGRDEGTD